MNKDDEDNVLTDSILNKEDDDNVNDNVDNIFCTLPETFSIIQDINAVNNFSPDIICHANEEQIATYYAGDDDLYSNNSPQTFNTVEETDVAIDFNPDKDITNKENQSDTYYAGVDVLVRYHVRQRWTYYVGQIEDMKIIDEELFYSIKYYKTIKKPTLIFRMTKKSIAMMFLRHL